MRSDYKVIDIKLQRAIHFVEKEYGVYIDYDYDYIKFKSQLDYLSYINRETDKASKKAKNKRR